MQINQLWTFYSAIHSSVPHTDASAHDLWLALARWLLSHCTVLCGTALACGWLRDGFVMLFVTALGGTRLLRGKGRAKIKDSVAMVGDLPEPIVGFSMVSVVT